MSRMGSHRLVTEAQLSVLRSFQSDAERLAYVDEEIDQRYDQSLGTDYDKAWSLLHSALQRSNPCSDYLDRTRNGPASWAILGAEDIALTEQALVTSLGKWKVFRVSFFLRSITANDIRSRLASAIETYGCRKLSLDDAEYAAEWFPRLKEFYRRAAKAHRPVLFVGDLV